METHLPRTCKSVSAVLGKHDIRTVPPQLRMAGHQPASLNDDDMSLPVAAYKAPASDKRGHPPPFAIPVRIFSRHNSSLNNYRSERKTHRQRSRLCAVASRHGPGVNRLHRHCAGDCKPENHARLESVINEPFLEARCDTRSKSVHVELLFTLDMFTRVKLILTSTHLDGQV